MRNLKSNYMEAGKMSVLTAASRQIERLSKTPPHKYHIYAQVTKAAVTMH